MKVRNPYDISTWGPACGRGLPYKDIGPVKDGQKGAIRKISYTRKARGMASGFDTRSVDGKLKINFVSFPVRCAKLMILSRSFIGIASVHPETAGNLLLRRPWKLVLWELPLWAIRYPPR